MTTQIKLQWKGGRVMQQINTASKRGLNKCSAILLKEMRRLMLEEPKSGKMYGTHRASAPGQAPASETGRMVASFRAKPDDKLDRPSTEITVQAPHFRFTEGGTKFMKPRPLLPTAVRNVKSRLENAVVIELLKVLSQP